MSRTSQWNFRRLVKLLSTSDWFGVGSVIGVVPRPRDLGPQPGTVAGGHEPAPIREHGEELKDLEPQLPAAHCVKIRRVWSASM